MNDLLALAERCERAAAEQQGDLIGDAWDAIGPITRPTGEQARRFGRMLDAEAYESAAMMLVPGYCEGWRVEDHPMAGPCAIAGEQEGYAATPALALVAAALRAQHAIAHG